MELEQQDPEDMCIGHWIEQGPECSRCRNDEFNYLCQNYISVRDYYEELRVEKTSTD